MRRRISLPALGRALVLASLLAALTAPAPAHAAGWVPATPPAGGADGPSRPVVAVDPAGDALAAWTDDDGAGTQTLLAAWRPAGGPWGAPRLLAARPGVDAPAVALDAAGNATVVWIDSADGVAFAARAARRDAGTGSWSAPHDFASAGRADARTQVRAGADGSAVAAWLEHDATSGVAFVRAAVWSPGGWSAPATLSDPGDAWAADGAPQIAPDATGGALVAWTAQRLDSPFDYAILTRRYLGAGAWSAIGTLLPDVGEPVSPVRLAGLDGGDAAATWFQGSSLAGGYRQGAGAWSVDPLSDDVAPACVPLQALGPDAGGGATVVWKAASTEGLEAARLTAGGPSPAGTAFASATEAAEEAAIDRGTVVLVAHDAAADADSVLAVRRQGGGWSAPALLQASAPGENLGGLDVAADAAGDALASWRRTDALGAKSLAAAAFQASAPQLTGVSVPARGTTGAPLSVSAAARATFAPIAQTSWDFGDGSPSVAGAAIAHAYARAGTYAITVTVADATGGTAQATRQVTIADPPATSPMPPPVGDRGGLLHPVVGTRLVLGRRTRVLAVPVRNPNGRTLRGRATLVRPRAGGRPPLTLASRRGVVLAPRRTSVVTLRLTDRALRALAHAPGHRLRATLTLRLRAADGRRVTVRRALTLDAAARFGAPPPSARSAC